jgi:hypothetical protein
MNTALPTVRTLIDQWEVKDLEDGSTFRIAVEFNPEMGNRSVPGLMVHYMGNIVNFEPVHVEKWAYQASKAGEAVYLLRDHSWTHLADQFVKVYLVTGEKLKARVEVKVKSKKNPVMKEYDLPFAVDL